MKRYSFIIYCLCFVLLVVRTDAQTVNPYHLNGSAFQENCNCYTLTPNQNFQSGSLWNVNKIDLTQSFDYKFNVFLGCTDADGADGIVFVLQPISTSIGTTGGGLGYEGVTPSIGITLDTWQNTDRNDPAYDHIAIHRNGDIDHNTSNNLSGPVTILPNVDNVEDCKWHVFRITWDATAKILKGYMDGHERVSANIDLVNTVYGGDPMVFWGFTGATGGSRNEQRVCTSLNPGFAFPQGQGTCYTDAIEFKDSSASFGTILKWYWDFGDGQVDSVQTPPPHRYAAPGKYTVQLKILANNGCTSEPFAKEIVVGSKPIAGFKSFQGPICENSSIALADSSYVEFGTINSWTWNVGNQTSGNRDPSLIKIDEPGDIPVTLKVKTREGCESDVYSATLVALPAPEIDFSFTEACVGSPSVFNAINLNPGITVQKWNWSLGDNNISNQESLQHLYAAGGKYEVQLSALGNNGCLSDVLLKEVNAYETNAFAGNDTIIADTQPLQLQAGGGTFYSWSPATGLSDPSIPNPVATLTNDMTYILTVSSPEGCSTNDTINIKVFKGPALYVPTAFTPNGDGRNDQLRFIAAGVTVDLFQVYNRYGQLVYSSNDLQKGWDGTFNGKEQSTGTYVWMIKGKDFTGAVHSKKGTVTLIK